VQLEGLGKLKKLGDLIGNATHDLPAYSIVPQPTMLLRALMYSHNIIILALSSDFRLNDIDHRRLDGKKGEALSIISDNPWDLFSIKWNTHLMFLNLRSSCIYSLILIIPTR
jgi:hypothetical protein